MPRSCLLPWLTSVGLLISCPNGTAADDRTPSLIQDENQKPGSLDWQLTRVRRDNDGIRSPWIEA
jgi:hypothetical protein